LVIVVQCICIGCLAVTDILIEGGNYTWMDSQKKLQNEWLLRTLVVDFFTHLRPSN
jgi:hypothetical protein